MVYPNPHLAPKQFTPVVPPLDPSKQIVGSSEQVDLSWADRDLDPVVAPSTLKPSPSAVVSQMKPKLTEPLGYNPTNFKT